MKSSGGDFDDHVMKLAETAKSMESAAHVIHDATYRIFEMVISAEDAAPAGLQTKNGCLESPVPAKKKEKAKMVTDWRFTVKEIKDIATKMRTPTERIRKLTQQFNVSLQKAVQGSDAHGAPSKEDADSTQINGFMKISDMDRKASELKKKLHAVAQDGELTVTLLQGAGHGWEDPKVVAAVKAVKDAVKKVNMPAPIKDMNRDLNDFERVVRNKVWEKVDGFAVTLEAKMLKMDSMVIKMHHLIKGILVVVESAAQGGLQTGNGGSVSPAPGKKSTVADWHGTVEEIGRLATKTQSLAIKVEGRMGRKINDVATKVRVAAKDAELSLIHLQVATARWEDPKIPDAVKAIRAAVCDIYHTVKIIGKDVNRLLRAKTKRAWEEIGRVATKMEERTSTMDSRAIELHHLIKGILVAVEGNDAKDHPVERNEAKDHPVERNEAKGYPPPVSTLLFQARRGKRGTKQPVRECMVFVSVPSLL